MLLAAVRVLVVLTSADPGDGSTRAIEQALHAALTRDATVEVRSEPPGTSDERLEAIADTEHAALLCVVSWSDHQRRVLVRSAKVPDGHFADREIRFDSADAPAERGRTVGFALASMMPDEAFAPTPPPPAPAAIAPSPPLNGITVGPAPRFEQAVPLPPPLRDNPLALDAAALAVAATDGYGGGFGGTVALRIPLVGALGAHGALSARAESIGPAAASSRAIVGSAGLAWQPWLDAKKRWALGARLDGLIVYLDVAHLDEDDAEAVHLSRVLPGLNAAAEGTFRFSDRASIIAAAGTEVVFGRTDLFVKERQVTSLPPAKLMAELGFRVFFP